MSRYLSARYQSLVPYVPGEQPKLTGETIKLNTNESPFPPSEKAKAYAAEASKKLERYCDTQCNALREKMAELYGVDKDEVIFTNGSDEVLSLCFMAFCDSDKTPVFPDITYGFYKVFADVYCLPYTEIPLTDDFRVDHKEYYHSGKTIFIANPNAPTGISLSKEEIRGIIENNPDDIVVIDEAYVDFGRQSVVPLIHEYDNLIVTGTFSKSRSMAGARLGFGFASKALITDLNTVRNSLNPYNVNTMTQAAGLGALCDEEYTRRNCEIIKENRAYLTDELRKLGFTVLPSDANFVFASHPNIGGKALYEYLKSRQIFIRHFETARLKDYNRITIGTREQLDKLIETIKEFPEA